MKTIRVGMLGIGNIAKGTWQTLERSRTHAESASGVSVQITKILNRHPERDRGIDIPKELYTTDVQEILHDPEIDIVLELIGGVEPATEYMAEALRSGKHVVTANKAALAANGRYLQDLAQQNHVLLRFEASVAGGIPILNAITDALTANEFTRVSGILNGTTNYILTQMREYGRTYEEALKDAQAKGFAEADPTADVEGYDAANKLAILLSLLFGVEVKPEEIPTRGITKIGAEDIGFAKNYGYHIKLLASAEARGDAVYGRVEPTLVPDDLPLAFVRNEFNAVFLSGNNVDNLMFYGKGAGPLPTGSAVAGDLITIARRIAQGNTDDPAPLLRYDAPVSYQGDGSGHYFVRTTVKDHPGVMGKLTTTLGNYGIGIETVIQLQQHDVDDTAQVIFILQETSREMLDKAIREMMDYDVVHAVNNILRVLA